MRSNRLLCDICRLTLELWRDEAPSIWAASCNCRQIRGTTCRGKETDIFYSTCSCNSNTACGLWGEALEKKKKWERVFYLDYDKLLLQSFPIRKLLPEAHVDGVSRRAAVVVFKLFQFWTQIRVETLISQFKRASNKRNEWFKRNRDSHLPFTYFSKLRSSTMVFWGSFRGSGWATVGSLVLANTWHLSCLQA